MITPEQLAKPEDGQRLETRRGRRDEQPRAGGSSGFDPTTLVEAMRTAPDSRPHCRDCFDRGLKAAIAVVEGAFGSGGA